MVFILILKKTLFLLTVLIIWRANACIWDIFNWDKITSSIQPDDLPQEISPVHSIYLSRGILCSYNSLSLFQTYIYLFELLPYVNIWIFWFFSRPALKGNLDFQLLNHTFLLIYLDPHITILKMYHVTNSTNNTTFF